jgi:predicted site-specific integrase-resolvase
MLDTKKPHLKFLDGWLPRRQWAIDLGYTERTLARWSEEGEIRTLYFRGATYHHVDDMQRKIEAGIRVRNPRRGAA